MAKTIEERAEDYSMYDNGLDKSMFEAYRDGAKDQRRIDIEKACEWWYLKLNELYPDLLEGETIEEFRKIMEED